MKMRNRHLRIFYLIFQGLRLGIELGLRLRLGLVSK